MSRSPQPPAVGETVKVVFQTSQPGADAQQLLADNIGAISQFQSKSRQQRELSGNPTATMQARLPGGGSARSVYNNGQETIYVRLDPVPGGEEESFEPKQPIPPPPPLLCIDMIFRNRLFTIGSIYSWQSEQIPGTPDAPPDSDPSDQPNFVEIATYPHADHTSNWNQDIATGGPFSVMWDHIPPLGDSWAIGGLSAPFPDPQAQIIGAAAGLGAHPASGDDAQFIGVYEWSHGRNSGGFGGGSSSQYINAIALYQRTAPPGSPTPGRRNFQDRRNYYDLLTVVGIRADPDGKPYEADSTGRTTDKRLEPLMQGAKVTVQRSATYAAGDADGLLGHCFVAKPLHDIVPGVDPEELVLDIYVDMTNVRQSNTLQNARSGSTFGVDDSSMDYTPEKTVLWKVQVRELQGISPKLVQVNLTTEGESRKFKSGVAPAPGQPPDQLVSATIIPQAREQSWIFAAAPNWVDKGGPPADRDATGTDGKPSMGKVLFPDPDKGDLTGYFIANVDGPIGPPRTVPSTVVWADGIDAMTKVATVKWTPSKDGIEHGKVDVRIY